MRSEPSNRRAEERTPSLDARETGSARLWLTAAAGVFALLAAVPWLMPFGPLTGGTSGTAAALGVTVIPGLVFLAASRRAGLLPRLRRALLLLAISILLTAAGNAVRLVDALGLSFPSVPGFDLASTFAIWALGFAGLILIPLAPLTPGTAWRIATDVTTAVLGISLSVVAIWTLPGIHAAPQAAHLKLVLYNVMATANLVVLNLILVRGLRRPIRRAIFWLAATIIIETTYLVALEYALGRQAHDFRLSNSLFFVDYLAYLCAAVSFLLDPPSERDGPLFPEALRAFNPLPVAAVVGVGALLILAALRPSGPALVPLAVGIVVLALLLLARVAAASEENVRLLRREAAEERRREVEKMELTGRLAGGIAHIINNLMTVVLGRSELALGSAGRTGGLRENLEAISEAARRASGLAERLLSASGRRMRDQKQMRVIDVVLSQREAVGRMAGPDRVLTWDLAEGEARVSPSDLEAVLLEIFSNAVDATAQGGRIAIRLRDETLEVAPAGTSPELRPGRYSVLEIADDGRGIAEEDLPHVFEPFYSSRPGHEGRGLGLSVVYGIVTSRGGGLLLDTGSATGTRVRILLPLDAPA